MNKRGAGEGEERRGGEGEEGRLSINKCNNFIQKRFWHISRGRPIFGDYSIIIIVSSTDIHNLSMYVGIYVCVSFVFCFFLLSTTEASQFDSANGTHDAYLSCDAAFSLCQEVVAQLDCGYPSNSNHSNSTNELTKAEGIAFFVVSLLSPPLSSLLSPPLSPSLSTSLSSSLLLSLLSLLSLLLSLLSLFSPPLSPLSFNPFFHPPTPQLPNPLPLFLPPLLPPFLSPLVLFSFSLVCIYQQVSRHSLIPSSPTLSSY